MAKLKTSNPYDDRFFEDPGTARSLASEPSPASESALSTHRGGTTVRLNLDLDRVLHRRLKQLALDEDQTVADVVRFLIAEAISAHREKH